MAKDGNFLIMFQYSEAIEFKFTNLIDAQIGWFYFTIVFLRSVVNPLLQIEHKNADTKYALLLTILNSNKVCHAPISNDLLALDESGYFEAHSNSNLEIKYPIN